MPKKRAVKKVVRKPPIVKSKPAIRRFVKDETIALAIFVLIVIALFYFKSLFVAASVNGIPISRFSVINQLEKTAGKQTLDALVNKELILQEAKRRKVNISNQEIDQRIKQVDKSIKQQGGNLEQVLKTQGLSQEDFRDQVEVQLVAEKLFANKIIVSDKEIDQFIEQNKASLPQVSQAGETTQLRKTIKQQIFQNKLGQKVQELIANLKRSAKIDYFVSY